MLTVLFNNDRPGRPLPAHTAHRQMVGTQCLVGRNGLHMKCERRLQSSEDQRHDALLLESGKCSAGGSVVSGMIHRVLCAQRVSVRKELGKESTVPVNRADEETRCAVHQRDIS